jgi:hypothetical protein
MHRTVLVFKTMRASSSHVGSGMNLSPLPPSHPPLSDDDDDVLSPNGDFYKVQPNMRVIQ